MKYGKAVLSRAQIGVSLIEVMVALFIMAVGLLGAAAMQLNALKYTDSSRYRTQATFIAYDMLDRIRANADATVLPTYALSSLTASAACSGACKIDIDDFKSNIGSTLPDGASGSITVEKSLVRIMIAWPEGRAGGRDDSGNDNQGSISVSSHVVVKVGA